MAVSKNRSKEKSLGVLDDSQRLEDFYWRMKTGRFNYVGSSY
ncbi:MAG: hypothetical protein ACK5RG_02045 [Cyclobacteriaceae bacterium]|jgi:hypothetical protein